MKLTKKQLSLSLGILTLGALVYILILESPDNNLKADNKVNRDAVSQNSAKRAIVDRKVDEPVDSDTTEISDQARNLVSQYKRLESSSSPESKLQLSLILDDCGRGKNHISSQKQIDDLELQAGVLPDTVEAIKKKFGFCKELYRYLGEQDYWELASAWLEDAAFSGNVVAQLMSAYRYADEPEADYILPILYDSLAYSQNNASLKGLVYNRALRFYADNKTPERPGIDQYNDDFRRGTDFDAWSFLSCKHDKNCDFKSLSELYKEHFYEYEYDNALARIAEFEKAIEEQQWSELGLE